MYTNIHFAVQPVDILHIYCMSMDILDKCLLMCILPKPLCYSMSRCMLTLQTHTRYSLCTYNLTLKCISVITRASPQNAPLKRDEFSLAVSPWCASMYTFAVITIFTQDVFAFSPDRGLFILSQYMTCRDVVRLCGHSDILLKWCRGVSIHCQCVFNFSIMFLCM